MDFPPGIPRAGEPLLVVALEEEARPLRDLGWPLLLTGVGKLRAATQLARALATARPSHLLNLGTAGSLAEGLSGVFPIGSVLQHDFDDESIAALTGQSFSPVLPLASHGPLLASGDRFVAGDPLREDLLARGARLVDMEGYAVAALARAFDLPVTLVKAVSDSAGEEAAQDWQATLHQCSHALAAWVRDNFPY
jgi:adenosylhomocysteine nucleosidase